MTILSKDISRVQGDNYPIEIVIRDASGNPLDLNGVTEIKLGVSPRQKLAEDETPVFVIDGTVTNAAGGVVEFPLTDTEANVEPRQYYAEIQWIKDGYRTTSQQFTYTVRGQIIR